jgi:hypothetical protein
MDYGPKIKNLAEDLKISSSTTNVSVKGSDGQYYSLMDIIEKQNTTIRALQILLLQKGIIVDEDEFQEIIDSIDVVHELTT